MGDRNLLPTPPLVSVIARTMGRPLLARALASLNAQAYRPIEVVLVDAANAGIEPPRLQGIAVRRVSRGAPLDRSAAANAGMEAASGEWLAFLDEDDEIEARHLQDLVATALVSRARVAYSQTRLVDRGGNTTRVFGGPFNRAALLRSNYLSIHAVLFHRSFVDLGARFDASVDGFEDWDFWLQLSRHGDFAFSGHPSAIYRAEEGLSGSGAGANLDREALLAKRERLMRKWQQPAP